MAKRHNKESLKSFMRVFGSDIKEFGPLLQRLKKDIGGEAFTEMYCTMLSVVPHASYTLMFDIEMIFTRLIH